LTARPDAAGAGLIAIAHWLLAVIVMLLAPDSVFGDIATFLSRLALLTFGGACAVLARVAQKPVGTFG